MLPRGIRWSTDSNRQSLGSSFQRLAVGPTTESLAVAQTRLSAIDMMSSPFLGGCRWASGNARRHLLLLTPMHRVDLEDVRSHLGGGGLHPVTPTNRRKRLQPTRANALHSNMRQRSSMRYGQSWGRPHPRMPTNPEKRCCRLLSRPKPRHHSALGQPEATGHLRAGGRRRREAGRSLAAVGSEFRGVWTDVRG